MTRAQKTMNQITALAARRESRAFVMLKALAIRLWRRIEDWWDKLTGVPTKSEVEAARQDWLTALRELERHVEQRTREPRRGKLH